MKKRSWIFCTVMITIITLSCVILTFASDTEKRLVYSCSAQVYEAFENERLEAFTKATGIKVELYVAASGVTIERLRHGFCGISSTVERLEFVLKESGYVEIPFCRDPMAIIVNSDCRVNNISEKQLQRVFSGSIKNWRELGGKNQPIIVVIPRKYTASYKNFDKQAMKRMDVRYDITTNKSTMVIELVKHLKNAISFIAQGAVSHQKGIKLLSVNGVNCYDKDYPYYQIFSFVTAGKPTGAESKFIDFALSEKGIAIMKKRGMIPLIK